MILGRKAWVVFCFLFLDFKYIYLFIYFGCVGSSFLCEGFLQLRRAGATLHRGAWASHRRGPSRCGAQAPDAQAQQLWLTGPAAPRHVGSSRTGTRTRVPCIGRWTPNHCATREAPWVKFQGNKNEVNFRGRILRHHKIDIRMTESAKYHSLSILHAKWLHSKRSPVFSPEIMCEQQSFPGEQDLYVKLQFLLADTRRNASAILFFFLVLFLAVLINFLVFSSLPQPFL